MTAPLWMIHPREKNLSRGYEPLTHWSQLVLVERYNSPDTWTITGPSETMSVFQPGSGSLLYRNGIQISTGKATGIKRSAEVVDDRLRDQTTISFASDLSPIGKRIIFPDPAHNLTTAISKFTASYDLRTGSIETLALGYIRSHAGNLAQLDRQIARLRIPASLNRGGSTQVTARLDNLGVLIRDLFEVGNLRIRVVHTEDVGGAWLDIVIDAVADVSGNIRFGSPDSSATGIIAEWSYEISEPTATRAIVAGGGEMSDREFLQIDDLTAEGLWGDAVEVLVDQRQVDPASPDKLSELTRAGQEALVEGAGPVKIAFTPLLGPDLEYRRDVRVGDIVGYDLPGLEPAKDKLREATTVVSVQDGEPTEAVSVVVGTPDAPSTRDQQQTARALRSINLIQRSQ